MQRLTSFRSLQDACTASLNRCFRPLSVGRHSGWRVRSDGLSRVRNTAETSELRSINCPDAQRVASGGERLMEPRNVVDRQNDRQAADKGQHHTQVTRSVSADLRPRRRQAPDGSLYRPQGWLRYRPKPPSWAW